MALKNITDDDIDKYFGTAQPIKLSRRDRAQTKQAAEIWYEEYVCTDEGRKAIMEEALKLTGEQAMLTPINPDASLYFHPTSGNSWDYGYLTNQFQPQPIDWSKVVQWNISTTTTTNTVPTPQPPEENLMRLFKAYVVKATKEDKKKTTYDVVLDDTLIAKDRESALLKVGQMISDKVNDDDTIHTHVVEVFSFAA